MTLLAHRGSYKTTCVSVALAIIIIMLPSYKILFVRKTGTNVTEIIRQVKNILRNPRTQQLVKIIHGKDLILTKDTENEINTNLAEDVKGTSQLVGMGIGTSITGKHFDIVFTDDIVAEEDRYSKAEREKTKRFYDELQNVVNRDANCRIFNTGTPWHKEDCIATKMPNKMTYDCYSTNLMDEEMIQKKKDDIPPSLFAANYELRYVADEDVLFNTPEQGADPALVQNGIGHVDSAFYGEDYTAFTMMCIHDGKYYVLGKLWRRHVEDCFPMIKDLYDENLCGKLYNETNADKGLVAKSMRQMGMKVVTYHEDTNKHVKIVTHLYKIWKDVIFVEGTDKEYIEQICYYNEMADHDDAPDSCACLARLLAKKNKTREGSTNSYLA